MVVDYKKDLHHSFMVIKGEDLIRSQTYCIKILKYQSINGILHIEQRTMDNESSYYIDITAKQSLYNLYEKNAFTYEKVKKLLQNLILTVENAYEYLFIEDDFVITPEFVYIDVASGNPYLCYLPGYAKKIQEQMVSFIEYIMNKVDYNDKEAVLLVYSLYGACREEGYTLDHLMDILNGRSFVSPEQDKEKEQPKYLNIHEKHTNIIEKSSMPHPFSQDIYDGNSGKLEVASSDPQKSGGHNSKPQKMKLQIPVMKERLEGEEEIPCYPIKTYLYTAFSVVICILLIGFCLISRIMYNAYSNQVDYMKLFALLLLTFCMEAYLLKKIWDKKHQITKIITRKEYVDPIREEYPPESGIKEFGLNEMNRREGMEQKSDTKIPEQKKYNQRVSDKKMSNNYRFKKIDLKNIYNKIRQHAELNFHVEKTDEIGIGRSITEERKKDDKRTVDKNFMQEFKNNASYNLHSEKQEESFKMKYNSMRGNENHLNSDQEEGDASCDHPTCLLNGYNPNKKPDDYEINRSKEDGAPMKHIILKPLDEIRYETIVINEFPFFIGKLKQNVDYCLENDVVSRYHAKISMEQEQYYVTDLNSRNGTYINNVPLDTYHSREIQIGDIVTFANIKYRLTTEEDL